VEKTRFQQREDSVKIFKVLLDTYEYSVMIIESAVERTKRK